MSPQQKTKQKFSPSASKKVFLEEDLPCKMLQKYAHLIIGLHEDSKDMVIEGGADFSK